MAKAAEHAQIAAQARQRYIDGLLRGLPGLVGHISGSARDLLDKPAEYLTAQRRRDLVAGLLKQAVNWQRTVASGLRHVLQHGATAVPMAELPPMLGDALSLVDNDTIEREILTSRLALAIMDRAGWEFTDLRSRVAMLERRAEIDTHDMLRAHILARVVLDSWRSVGLSATDWREAQPLLHEGFAALAEEAYHETNRWLIEQKVMPDVDLRPYIRRSTGAGAPGLVGSAGLSPAHPPAGVAAGPGYATTAWRGPATENGAWRSAGGRAAASHERSADVGEETRMMTRAGPMARGSDHAEAVLGRLNRLVGRHLPGFADTTQARPVTDALSAAINNAQQNLRKRFAPAEGAEPVGQAAAGHRTHRTDAARRVAAEQAGAQAGRQHTGRARHDRDRGADVPEHPDRRAHPARDAGLVCPLADAGAAGGGERA